MALYENPNNGYRERVGFRSFLGALLLGPIYYALKGAWGHAIVHGIGVFLLFGLTVSTFGLGLPLLLVWWGLYALPAPWIAGKQYLRSGWRQVD